MKKVYLGAFGNGCFIKAQYEVDGDSVLFLEHGRRYEHFPNGGTVYFTESDKTDEIENRLIKFEIDTDKDISRRFNEYENNSNKFQASMNNIIPLDENEIIEVFSLDINIDDFLKDKSKRRFRINHKPNRKILLKIDDCCYGPFEFTLETEEQQLYLKVIIETELINMYLYKNIEKYVLDASFSIRQTDKLQFIYNINKIQNIECETIEYIDEDKLMDLLKKVLENSYTLDEVVKMSENFSRIINSFNDPKELDLSEEKVKRLAQLLKNAKELKIYKNKIVEDYFKYNSNSQIDKVTYLDEHKEIIDDLAKKDCRYEELCNQYQDEINELLERIRKAKEVLEEQQTKFDEYQDRVLKEKKSELDELKSLKEKTQKEIELFETNKERLRETIETMKLEKFEIENNIKKKISDWAAENRNSEMVNLLFSELAFYKKPTELKPLFEKPILKMNTAKEFMLLVQSKLVASGRNYREDEVFNYIISIAQNYITVFAGEPGTGKTSLCRLLAKSFGLYSERYAEIMVERGWMSSKDLVGYYNPLTKEVEKVQPDFSICMETLSSERKQEKEKIPYFVLLDEANLSPIEFYWSDFNYYCDSPELQTIKYSNGEEYKFGEELKFFATINYDHTTEMLSPRFLDRAWVILMCSDVNIDNIIAFSQNNMEIEDNEEVVSYSDLVKYFGKSKASERKMNPVTKERLNVVINKMNAGGHSISARSVKAICNYYLVAEEYMSSKEVALDFAIAQKILPLIAGNGKAYEKFLQELLEMCNDSQLERCAQIVQKILNKGEHEFYGFFSA